MYTGSKILAIGRNYAAHAAEMGAPASGKRAAPLFFLKPSSSVIHPGAAIVRPRGVAALHHEVELGVVIGARARHMPAASWAAHVAGYVLALDMTARDLQAAAKASGGPWTHAKCYDTFTPLSLLIPAAAVADPAELELVLYVDGELRQRGRTADMMHSVPELLAFLSTVMTLEPGDVVLTGTPAGVGPVAPGQTIRASITGLVTMSFPVVDETA